MSVRHSGVRKLLAIGAAFAVAIALPLPVEAARADDAPVAQASAQPWIDASRITGLTSDTAAASCWEIKQLHPDYPSGAYWLLTQSMDAPGQFWCDQETDGGGWVRVGQGRQDWEYYAAGRGASSALLQALPAANSGTIQLPTKLINGLLNNKPVTSLSEGIRVRRALDTAGTNWQEVQFKPAKAVGWFWTMGAKWPLSSWKIGTATGTSGGTNSFGTGSAQLVVDTGNQNQTQKYKWSFSYGSGVAGTTADSSYLWSGADNAGGARPYSFVYIRPQISSSDFSYSRIPDSGLAKIEQAIVPDSNALANPWGVTGMAAPRQREGDVEVQDMVAVGNTMFVGGAFRYVQRDQAGTGQVEQPFLAAFNATTGEYIPSFKPVLNEAVLAIAPAGNGRLAIGGKFTTAGGQPAAGFALIDATTGAVSGPQPTLTDASSPGSVRVEDIKASGGDLFIGGSFTHTTGPTGPTRYTRNVSRINATTAMPVVGWQPEFNGSVNDMDVSPSGKVFFAGFFTQIGTQTANRAAALPVSGDPVPYNWTPTWSSSNDYQRAIVTKGDRVYVGGSEHSMFSYDTNTFQRISTHVTDPKGDFQTLSIAGDFLIGGSHSNWFIYQGATQWSNIGTAWSRADATSWITSWKLDGGANPVVENFRPSINSRTGEAGWATAVAPDGTIWTGGDFESAKLQSGSSGWTGAFVRFGYTDGTAPNTPTNLRSTATTASTVSLAWGAPSGGIGNGGSYQVLRDDRVIATTTSTSITVPLGGEQRYFVRAADKAGNLSATTTALKIAGGNAAPVAKIQQSVSGLDVAFDGTGSTDDGTIAGYYWNFGDGTTGTGATAAHRYFSGGKYPVLLTVVDDKGAWTTTAYTLDLAQPRPADAYGGRVFDDQPQAYWRMDETTGTRAADSATGTRSANYQQGVSLGATGIPGSTAASFDGSNDVMVANDLVQGSNNFSVEIWFNTTTTRGGKLIGFGNAASGLSSSYDRHIYMQNDGKLVFGVYSGATYTITSPNAYNNGQWHHAVGTLSPSGMTFYVDGQLVGTNAQSVAQDYAGYWRVGGDTTWGSTSAYFNGRLDEAAVYDRPLTARQVWKHYATGLNLPNQAPTASFTSDSDGLALTVDGTASSDIDGDVVSGSWDFGDGTPAVSGLSATHTYSTTGTYSVTLTVKDDQGTTGTLTRSVAIVKRPTDQYGGLIYDEKPWAYWRFGESSSSTASDSSRGGHAATYREGVTLGATGIHPGTSAASFDGQNDLVSANDQIQGPQTFSTELWFKTTTTRGGKLIGFGRANQGNSSSYDRHIYMQDDGKLVFGVYDGATYTITSANSYNDGAWHYVASTLSSAGLALYVDGQLVGTNAHTVAENFPGYWRVGGDNTWGSSSAYFAGVIDEVAIYDKAITAGQVANHYAIGSIIPNQAPDAKFSYVANYLTVSFDGSASTDLDGTIQKIAWDFGDGEHAVGSLFTHQYAHAGTYTVAMTATDDDGDSTTVTKQLVVEEPPNQAPTASFSTDVNYLKVGFDASASTDADGHIVSWDWNLGDGTSKSGETVSHTYTASGDYTVTLEVKDDKGDSGTVSQVVHVEKAPNQAPDAQFSFTPTFLKVAFDGTASSDPDGSIASVRWDFADGSAPVTGGASVLTQEHTYAAGGTYAVTLKVTDNEGASTTTSRSVTVAPEPPNAPPVADFSQTADFLDVSFDGSASSDSDGHIANWAWNFGDGTATVNGSAPTVSHSFADAGTYSVKLTVTDDDGATNTVTKSVTVSKKPVNTPPVADFSQTATHLAVDFDGSLSSDAEGPIVSWAWNFGDGALKSGKNVSHTYAAAGAYPVTLTVTDGAGAQASVTRTITVAAAPNTPPTAAFDFTATYLDVAFDGSASTDAEGPISSWAWNFGDGSTKSGAQVSHTYASAGTYTVTLKVKDAAGAESTLVKSVSVTAAPTTPTTREVVSRDSSWAYRYATSAPPSDWAQVGFNPSGWSTGAGPIGYGSTLVATNLNPAAATADRPISAYFRSTFDVADASKAVSLNLSAIGDDGVVVYVNGVEVGRKNMPTGTITNGSYAVAARRVTVAQNDMLTIDVPKSLLVNGTNVIAAETHVNYRATPDMTFWATASLTELSGPPAPNQAPTASFAYTPTNLDVAFDASASADADGSIANWAWNFGDGASGSGALASHTYAAAGGYDVTLTVTDNQGAVGTSTQRVNVTAPTGTPTTREVVSRDSSWAYRYATSAPPSDWAQVGFNPSGWSTGAGPIGYGSTLVATNLNPAAATADRPISAYFRSTFDVADASKAVSLNLSAIGDDGVVVYVNGVEVGRKNMPTGTITNGSYAVAARRVTVAQNDMLTIDVPKSLLVNGTNVIAAETHVNYRATPDMTFWATASLTELR